MCGSLEAIREILRSGELGALSYLRLSRRHPDVDLGTDVAGLLALAQEWLGEVERVHARGQWVGETGALTLVSDHPAGAVGLIDLSTATSSLGFEPLATLARIEGDKGTLEILPGPIMRQSAPGWREERQVDALILPQAGPEIESVLQRAMASAESGEAR